MPTYVIVNRQPQGYRGSAAARAAWNAWFDRLGHHLVDRGNPVVARASVGRVDAGTALGGYTLVTADDLDGAVALAADCPAARDGGGAEVGELLLLNAGFRRQVALAAPPEAVFAALATPAGVAGWWMPATGSGDEGGELHLSFPNGAAALRVDAATPGSAVAWTVLTCEPEPDWAGTRIVFGLRPDGAGGTLLDFGHDGLAQLPCYDVCRQGWDFYLASLHDYVETGTGRPGNRHGNRHG